jgi:hypothetical protein
VEIYLLITLIAAIAIITTGVIGIIGMRNKGQQQPLPDLVTPAPINWDRRMFTWLIIIGLCFLVFSGLTAWFVLYNVAQSQHLWCHVLVTLNNPPAGAAAPKAGSYGAKLVQDFIMLQRGLGC